MAASMRRLTWPALQNARDLGGLPLTGGGATRFGVMVRADSSARLTADGVASALRYGVTSVIDLRERPLVETDPSPLAGRHDVEYGHIPLLPDDFPLPVVRGGYEAAVDAAQLRIADVARAFSAAEGTTLVHCHSGVGRTGIVAAVVLAVAEVRWEAIIEDYRLDLDDPDETDAGATIRRHLESRYGGIRPYLLGAGLSEADVSRLRARLRGADLN